jgi:chemotaxis-related protein WspD
MNPNESKARVIDDCWNRIGVWSRANPRCPKLEQAIHCHNCEVYVQAGRELRDRPAPAGYLEEWRAHYARPAIRRDAAASASALAFRIGDEWLALPAEMIEEVADIAPVHGIPHRSSGPLLGIAHIHGRLHLCVSLAKLLDIEARGASTEEKKRVPRTVLMRRGENGFAFAADEVWGCVRHAPEDILETPATLSRSLRKYSVGVLMLGDKSVGRLDGELLFYALEKNLG